MACPNTAKSRIAMRLTGASIPNALFRPREVAPCRNSGHQSTGGYTLVEVMVVTALLTLLMVAAAGSISAGKLISTRLSDYTAAMAVVEAQIDNIRSTTYNPPTSPFTSSTVVLTNTSSIALNQAGATFIIPGTITSTIQPIASGHLVTVSGTFQTRGKPITVSLQTVVNTFAAGQQ